MRRRDFLVAAGATAAAVGCGRGASTPVPDGAGLASAAGAASPPGRQQVRMHVGCQRSPTSAAMLQFFKRHGVDQVCGYPSVPKGSGAWTREDVERTRDLCRRHGVTLSMVALPFLTSSHIDRERRGAIMLGQSPERDRDIEDVHRMIRACAQAGIPAFKYNMSLLGVLRTGSTPGRGGSSYSTWREAKATANPPLTRAGRVTADIAWERITYFLERVIPVCNEYKVRACCHPHDPGVALAGFQGVSRVLGTVDGLKKFVTIQASPFHGLNLCLGSVAEMLADPRREIVDVIRHFGAQRKIFNVHFRNIRGKRGDFQEVYHDEGDMNMVEVIRALHAADYDGMVMPDHVPHHPDDPQGHQAFAFAYGYIKALIQSLDAGG